jgi:AcrR family transcriptional regulator
MGRKDEVERRLVELFLGEGFSALTLEAMTRRLSCSRATLYEIAPSRQDLVRHVIGIFFRDSAAKADDAIAAADGPAQAIRAYFAQIASDLRPASPAFLRDLSTDPSARAIYEMNTRFAAKRVRDLLTAGREQGVFRNANVEFASEMVSSMIALIQEGKLRSEYGLADGDAFDELAEILLNGIVVRRPRSQGADTGASGASTTGPKASGSGTGG